MDSWQLVPYGTGPQQADSPGLLQRQDSRDRLKCERQGIPLIVVWMQKWLRGRQCTNLSLCLDAAKPYMLSRGIPHGHVLANFVDLGEIIAADTPCFKLSQVEVYEAIFDLDGREGFQCLGLNRCGDSRKLASIFRRVLDWYLWMRREPSKYRTGIRHLQAAGRPLERVIDLVKKLDATGGDDSWAELPEPSPKAPPPSEALAKTPAPKDWKHLISLLDDTIAPRRGETVQAAPASASNPIADSLVLRVGSFNPMATLSPLRVGAFNPMATVSPLKTTSVGAFNPMATLSPLKTTSMADQVARCASVPLTGTKGCLQRAVTVASKRKAPAKETPAKETRAKRILAKTTPEKEADPTRLKIKKIRSGTKSGAYEIKKIRSLASKKARKEAEAEGLDIEAAKARARMAYNAPI